MPGLSTDVSEMEAFVADAEVEALAHIPDPDGTLWRRFGVWRQRTYVLINDDGTTRVTGYGNLAGDVEELVASVTWE